MDVSVFIGATWEVPLEQKQALLPAAQALGLTEATYQDFTSERQVAIILYVTARPSMAGLPSFPTETFGPSVGSTPGPHLPGVEYTVVLFSGTVEGAFRFLPEVRGKVDQYKSMARKALIDHAKIGVDVILARDPVAYPDREAHVATYLSAVQAVA